MMRNWLKGAVGPDDNDSRFLLDVHRRDLPGEDTVRYAMATRWTSASWAPGPAARCWPSAWPRVAEKMISGTAAGR